MPKKKVLLHGTLKDWTKFTTQNNEKKKENNAYIFFFAFVCMWDHPHAHNDQRQPPENVPTPGRAQVDHFNLFSRNTALVVADSSTTMSTWGLIAIRSTRARAHTHTHTSLYDTQQPHVKGEKATIFTASRCFLSRTA